MAGELPVGSELVRHGRRAARRAGLDPALFAGHSLRAGLATTAAKAGKSERAIMRQTGHRSVAMVRRYIREAEPFEDNAGVAVGHANIVRSMSLINESIEVTRPAA